MGARGLVVAALCVLAGSSIFVGEALASSAAPQIERVWAAQVGVTGATLDAKIVPDPETLPETGSDTTYRFQYGTSASYGTSVPVPDAAIDASTTAVDVSESLGGLQAHTVYHYRVIATNPSGEAASPDRVFTTFSTPASGDTCPNALVRGAQFSSYLPDCRAYELVSPPYDGKEGANIGTTPFLTQSAVDGNAIKFYSKAGFGDVRGGESLGGAEYVAQRGIEGWATHSINPEQGSRRLEIESFTHYEALSPDLSKGIFFAFTPVLPGHPNVERVNNLYARNDLLSPGPGEYELLNDAASPVTASLRSKFIQSPAEVSVAAVSTDWSHILFESNHDLTPESAGLNPEFAKAYEWDEGTVRLVGILPDGAPAEQSIAGKGAQGGASGVPNVVRPGEVDKVTSGWNANAISADGSRVIFTGSPFSFRDGKNVDPIMGSLYMRIDHKLTIQLNVSERTEGPDPNGPLPATFTAATPDDSKVFFITNEALTDDAPLDASSHKLYMYDLNAPEGHHLTLISIDSEPAGTGGNLAEAVVGMDDGADYVYFVGENSLLPNLPPFVPGSVDHRRLYVWHNGTLHFVVSHHEVNDGSNGFAWATGALEEGDTFRTSTDGKTVIFVSDDPSTALRTGYDNHDPTNTCVGAPAEPEQRCYEVYVYNVDREELLCASCNSSGAPARSDASFIDVVDAYNLKTQYLNHPMSSDGRFVFFDTRESLVPQDTNGQIDVYEYDTATKQQELVSSGTCDCGSYFVDASPDGHNLFFTTHQRLVYVDIDTSADLYDARIEGGIPAQNHPPKVSCAGEECQGPVPNPPVFSLPASSTFVGGGNLAAGKPAVKKQVKHKVKRKASARKRHGVKRKKDRKRGRKSNGRASHRSGR